jgi:hypothetical protein
MNHAMIVAGILNKLVTPQSEVMMKPVRKSVDWPYVVGLLVLPFLVIGIILLVGWIQGKTRYNPNYFEEPYLSHYEVPNELLMDLENAFRTGDRELLAKTQGTHRMVEQLDAVPTLRYMIFVEFEGDYTDYLFMDTSNYKRYLMHLKVVNGRYVNVPDGLYYLVDSGNWLQTVGPLAAVWWLIVVLFTIGFWIYRSMAAARQEMFGRLS